MSIAEKFEVIADAVYEKGKQAEYDRFWDSYQENGNKRFYGYAFAYWNDEVFKPKYTIMTDVNANRSNFMFGYATLTEIMTPLYFYDTTSNSTFYYCNKCVKIGDDTGGGIWVTRNRLYTSNFATCKVLEEIRFLDYNEKGEYVPSEIGNSISFSDCSLLSVASMKNIINHLVNLKQEGLTSQTLTFHTDAWARLEADSSAPDGGTWSEYVQSLGWSI